MATRVRRFCRHRHLSCHVVGDKATKLHSPRNNNDRPKIAALGAVGLDYIATVDSYPAADDKIRATSSTETGGGNAGNAITACARLGCETSVASKLGNDGPGRSVIAELERDGVQSSMLIVSSTSSSPFTYIIADQNSGTRTCIHTPSEPLHQADVNVQALVHAKDVLFLDGRHPSAALEAAKAAKDDGNLLLVVEAERPRDGLDDLLQLADVVTLSASFARSAGFVSDDTDAADDAGLLGLMHTVEHACPNAIAAYRTLGSRGLVCMTREHNRTESSAQVHTLSRVQDIPAELHPGPAPDAPSEHQVCAPVVASASRGVSLAQTERVWWPSRITAAGVSSAYVVDSTGAGDALNGATAAYLGAGLPLVDALQRASCVAALSLRAVGPRPGLPTSDELHRLVVDQTDDVNRPAATTVSLQR